MSSLAGECGEHVGSPGSACDSSWSWRRADEHVCQEATGMTKRRKHNRIHCGVARLRPSRLCLAGSTAKSRCVAILGLLVAIHLHEANGQPKFIDGVVTFKENGLLKKADGTPANGFQFEVPCLVSNKVPNCAIRTQMKWGQQLSCTTGAICFLVTTLDATDVVFLPSPGFTDHMDMRTFKCTVSEVAADPSDPLFSRLRMRKYDILDVQGFPEFTSRQDLELCFETIPAGAGRRCVQFYFGVPPYDLRISVDGGAFVSGAVSRSSPYERSRVAVRVRDANVQDQVCIDYPATFKAVSNTPDRAPDDADTAYFKWQDTDGALRQCGTSACFLQEACRLQCCYAGTRCLSGLSSGVECTGGEWERVFTLKVKTNNATLVFGDSASGFQVRSMSRFSVPGNEAYNDRTVESVRLVFHTVLRTPSLIDAVPGTARARGTPLRMELLETAFINCPIPTVAIYSVLQIWSNTTTSNGLRFSYLSSEQVEISALGDVPVGAALSTRARISLPSYQDRDGGDGNFQLQGSISVLELDWIPRRGQEGRVHKVCFEARGIVSGARNSRCFQIPVARCQYCTVQGDSLKSLAVAFKTSWLQLWAANAGPAFAGETESTYPINPASLPPRTRLSLGPIYVVKSHDSIDALATRFHTTEDQIMEMNPDLADDWAGAIKKLKVGQELCIIPDVCPSEAE